jgi:hypothetical protein
MRQSWTFQTDSQVEVLQYSRLALYLPNGLEQREAPALGSTVQDTIQKLLMK